MTLDPHSISSAWLASLASAVKSGDPDAFAALFLPDGWFRDLLVFTWDIRSLEGREKIQAFLATTLSGAQLSDLKLDAAPELAPRTSFIGQLQANDVEFGLLFECGHGLGRGHVRLLQDANGDYKAFTVLMALSDLRGYEEVSTLILRDDLTGVPGRDMQQEFANWVIEAETNPHVLIGRVSSLRGATWSTHTHTE